MMPPNLQIVPNPFHALDHEGIPAATFPFDPEHAGGARRWVGARIDTSAGPDGVARSRPLAQAYDQVMTGQRYDATTKRNVAYSVRVNAAQDSRIQYSFDLTAQPYPCTTHYVRGVQSGAILAGDAATARACGVPWQDPAVVLRREAAAVIARWEADMGEPPPLHAWPDVLRAVLDAPKAPPAVVDATPPATKVADVAKAPQRASNAIAPTCAPDVEGAAK